MIRSILHRSQTSVVSTWHRIKLKPRQQYPIITTLVVTAALLGLGIHATATHNAVHAVNGTGKSTVSKANDQSKSQLKTATTSGSTNGEATTVSSGSKTSSHNGSTNSTTSTDNTNTGSSNPTSKTSNPVGGTTNKGTADFTLSTSSVSMPSNAPESVVVTAKVTGSKALSIRPNDGSTVDAGYDNTQPSTTQTLYVRHVGNATPGTYTLTVTARDPYDSSLQPVTKSITVNLTAPYSFNFSIVTGGITKTYNGDGTNTVSIPVTINRINGHHYPLSALLQFSAYDYNHGGGQPADPYGNFGGTVPGDATSYTFVERVDARANTVSISIHDDLGNAVNYQGSRL